MSSKGTKMSVADDPESLRTKRNQVCYNVVAYQVLISFKLPISGPDLGSTIIVHPGEEDGKFLLY